MEFHLRILAVVYLVFGVLGVCGALVVTVLFVGAAGIAGLVAMDQPEVWFAMPVLGLLGMTLAMFILALSLPGIVAAIGLLKFRPWARVLAIVLSLLNLLNIPFGTVLGIYGLWILLARETELLFGVPARAG